MVTALWSVPEPERAGRPLLVLFHGHGLHESVGHELWRVLPPAVVVASIRAPRQRGGGHSWFDLDPAVGPSQADDAAKEILAWLDVQPPAPSVGLVGFSQGGAAAAQLMRAAPHRFGYLAVLAGFVIPHPHPGDRVLARLRPPVLWSRGRDDRRIPTDLIDSTHAYLAKHSTLDQRVYTGLGHGASLPQLLDLQAFVDRHMNLPHRD